MNTIAEGATVRGVLGNGTGFAGVVVQCYTVPMHGFDLPMVKVQRDNGEGFAYAAVGDVEAIEVRECDAFAVQHEAVISGYWQGFTMRGLTAEAAVECASIRQRFGSRNVRILPDPANNGRATTGGWV